MSTEKYLKTAQQTTNGLTSIGRKYYTSDGTEIKNIVETFEMKEPAIYGGVKVKKIDKINKQSQGDATLQNAELTIYANETIHYIKDGTTKTWNANDSTGIVLKTDSNGIASTSNNALPYGSYYVKETKASKGYLLNTTWRVDFNIRENNQIIDLSKDTTKFLPETIIKGGLRVVKVDRETSLQTPQAEATLENAEVTIYNNSKQAIEYNGTLYPKDAAILTIRTDKNGVASTGSVLPYGSYYVKETKASNGYVLNADWRVDFQIREDNKIVDLSDETQKITADQNLSGWLNNNTNARLPQDIKRFDIAFKKVDADGSSMANIPFVISRLENNKIVERHVIATDENGNVNTAERLKVNNVNTLDEFFDINTGLIDSDKINGTSNVWFGEQSAVRNDRGSFIYGNYTIQELPCPANAGHDLLTQTLFNEKFDLSNIVNGKTYHLNNIFVDLQINPKSDAVATINGRKVLPLDSMSVTDTLTMYNLKTTSEYKVVADAYYIDRDGNETRVGTNKLMFTPTVSNSEHSEKVDVPITIESFNGGYVALVSHLYIKNNNNVWVKLLEHNVDYSEETQKVFIPFVSTTAQDGSTKDKIGTVIENAEIIDTLTYENLDDETLYLITGTLRFADTGEIVKDHEGNDCVVNQTLYTNWSKDKVDFHLIYGLVGPKDGKVVMPAFKFDGSQLEGKTVVVTEVITEYDSGKVVVEHNDLQDQDQTIYFPKIRTKARDKNTVMHTSVTGTTTIVDKVSLENMVVGKEYTLNGELVHKKDFVDKNGVAHKKGDVIAKHEPVVFTAKEVNIELELSFEVDASLFEGASAVVFEDLWFNGIEVTTHHNYESDDQTINWPKVRTTAIDNVTNTHTGLLQDDIFIVDKVELTNLTVGESYRVYAKVLNKNTDKFLTIQEHEGEMIGITEEFIATDADMMVPVNIKLNKAEINHGESIVIFEYLQVKTSDDFVNVATHEDKKDLHQTIDFPKIGTTAKDGQTSDNVGTVGKTTIIDKVAYTNLVIGEEYNIAGTLHYKEDFTDKNNVKHLAGDAVEADGKPITAEVTFVAETKNGFIDLVYELDSSLLEGTSVVVFENLYNNAVKVATHNDIEDKAQTVSYPKIRTKATDSETNNHISMADREVTIIDEVSYTNLVIGQTYTINGIMMNKETAKPLIIDGKQVTATKTFVASAKNGIIKVEFKFDGTLLANQTLVVFEDLVHNNIIIATHSDIDDVEQTIHFPEAKTKARDKADDDNIIDGTKTKQTIVDKVTYSNLIAGKEYTIVGKLVEKESGEFVVDKDKKIVTSTKTFIAEQSSGTVELEFTFDATPYAAKKLVVFESVLFNDKEIAVHADIEDKYQTIFVSMILDVRIAKADKDKIHYFLKGAEITIFNQNDEVVKDVDGKDCIGITDEKGEVSFKIVYDGENTFYAKETKAPKGYQINPDKFEVVPKFEHVLGTELIKMTILDSIIIIPPRTGVDSNITFYAILFVFSISALFILRKKKSH